MLLHGQGQCFAFSHLRVNSVRQLSEYVCQLRSPLICRPLRALVLSWGETDQSEVASCLHVLGVTPESQVERVPLVASYVVRDLFGAREEAADDSNTQSLSRVPLDEHGVAVSDAGIGNLNTLNVPPELSEPIALQSFAQQALQGIFTLRRISDPSFVSTVHRSRRFSAVVRIIHLYSIAPMLAKLFVTDHSICSAISGQNHICVDVRAGPLVYLLSTAFAEGDLVFLRDVEIYGDEGVVRCSADWMSCAEQVCVASSNATAGARPLHEPIVKMKDLDIPVRACEALLVQRVAAAKFRFVRLEPLQLPSTDLLLSLEAHATSVLPVHAKLWFPACTVCKRLVNVCQLLSGYDCAHCKRKYSHQKGVILLQFL